jgi:hypothetical protein
VNVDHRPEIRQPHLCEGFVAQVAGIVDQDVHAPPGIDRLLDHGFDGRLVGHRCAVPDRLAAGRTNLLRHAFCRSGATAGAVARAAQIIDHHSCTARRQRQSMLSAEPSPRAGHDRDPILELNCHLLS